MKSSLFLQGLLWAYMLSFGLKLRKKNKLQVIFTVSKRAWFPLYGNNPKLTSLNYKKIVKNSKRKIHRNYRRKSLWIWSLKLTKRFDGNPNTVTLSRMLRMSTRQNIRNIRKRKCGPIDSLSVRHLEMAPYMPPQAKFKILQNFQMYFSREPFVL